MKPFGLAIISLALVVVASASPLFNSNSATTVVDIPVFADYKFGQKCPAPVFSDGCNTCVCSKDGVNAACTLKACLDFDIPKRAVQSDLPVVYGYKQGGKCPAQQFYDDCNSCICFVDGHSAACTRMACPPHREARSVPDVPEVQGYQQGDKCPAEQFYDDCNSCICSVDGQSAACTRMACPPHREAQGYQQGDKCPAEQFYNDCNSCICSVDGHSAACTKMACPRRGATVPHIDTPPLKCIPNRLFTYDHNICYCNEDGTELTCKRKMYSTLTPDLYLVQLQNLTMECAPKRHFQFSNQDCICQESGRFASCVRKNQDNGGDSRENCFPGAVFQDDCNGCICGSDGKASCTNMNCLMLDNINSGRKPQPSDVTMNCQADKIFDYNCHQCICDAKGNYAMCSGKECPTSLDYFTEVKDTVEKCNPGMIFANDCNVCICSKNGKGVCTTFSCDTTYRFKYFDQLTLQKPRVPRVTYHDRLIFV
ncbi:hypothetical protein TSAR_010204 [Trichomalopsis sarcophagae]|uniref:Pacifastin domain-containing protein n=1 Tax=Trichomalopsis sarcophagae TaxID=543379 RepID=A0A232EZG7_9HYME|nr:hypothetical protein TSAR_010204 [Trichomalopsis sarcophagae]